MNFAHSISKSTKVCYKERCAGVLIHSFHMHAACVFLGRGGLPPNNANSTLELKSVGLELKAIKPKLLDHMN